VKLADLFELWWHETHERIEKKQNRLASGINTEARRQGARQETTTIPAE
jgi:hypothetical protein